MSVPVFIPTIFNVSLSKRELAYCLGISPYRLKCLINKERKVLERLGYSKYDKMLYPPTINHILAKSGLRLIEERRIEVLSRAYAHG